MSSPLSAFTQGTTPGAASGETQSSSQLPAWYTNYTQQILNTAAQFAAQPYQAYSGPRIAAQTNNTLNAQNQVGALPGQSNDLTNQATAQAQTAAKENDPLGAANPYLAAGTNPTYNTVQNYQNPYNKDVTDAIATAGAENFQNNTLPAIQSSIVGAGNITGASTEGANLIQNAELNENQAVSQAQSGALQSGYNSSLAAAQNQNANELTAAGTAGSLNSSQVANGLNAGTTLANINTAGTNNNLAAIGAENSLGNQQQGQVQSNENLAYQDFQNQLNYPLTGAGIMQGALSGIQVPTGTTNYSYGTNLPSTTGAAPVSSLIGALGTYNANNTQPSTQPPP